MNPRDRQELHEESTSSAAKVDCSLWCRAIFPAHILFFAGVWVCYPETGWQAWNWIYLAFMFWVLQRLSLRFSQRPSQRLAEENRILRLLGKVLIWTWLGLCTLPLLVVLVIFWLPEVWTPQ